MSWYITWKWLLFDGLIDIRFTISLNPFTIIISSDGQISWSISQIVTNSLAKSETQHNVCCACVKNLYSFRFIRLKFDRLKVHAHTLLENLHIHISSFFCECWPTAVLLELFGVDHGQIALANKNHHWFWESHLTDC